MTHLEKFRKEKDEFFAHHPQSPLTDDQKRHFRGLIYFPENPELRFETEIEQFPDPQEIRMQTSTGTVQPYHRYGQIHFTVDQQAAVLTLYESDHELFLPFVDVLAGTDTYGAGRYLEPRLLGNGKVWIDFNEAYNPYCAYNTRWSCPIPPSENRLKVAIQAGEKIFEDHP